jgi:hypothetical protein
MLRSTTRVLAVALSAALLGAVAPASSAQAAEEAAPAVTVVGANGSGCPSSTATARSQADGSYAIDFEGYFAYSGEEAPVTAFRKNCQFALQVARPAGWTYAVAYARYSGFALLNDGVAGLAQASYYFQGQTGTTVGSHRFDGPIAERWDVSDVLVPDRLVYAPCSAERLLNINTELRVSAQPADAELNALVIDPTITLRLTWQRCS